MIYIISESENGPVKIGISGDLRGVHRRLADLQVGNPRRLRIVGTFFGHFAQERRIHERLADKRLVGEWFDLAEKMANAVVNEILSEQEQIIEQYIESISEKRASLKKFRRVFDFYKDRPAHKRWAAK